MFEKIFGIFRKKKKGDFSAGFSAETDEDMFDLGDTGMDDDFDADTISLETGMSDGGFSGVSSGGGMAESDPGFGDTFGDLESPGDNKGIGTLDLDEESPADIAGLDEPITPPPDVMPLEEEPYAAAMPKKSRKGLLVTIVVAIIGLLAGFFMSTPSSVEKMRRAISSEPTVLEQLATLTEENTKLNNTLKAYRSVGSVDEILAIKAELSKREEITADLARIEAKVADQAGLEERLDRVDAQLVQARRRLTIQEGTLANVQKSLKQIEARNNYLISSTRMHLDQINEAAAKSEELKARLSSERVQKAEAEAMVSRDVQQGVEQTALEALSSL